jgi:hypothetical protein
MGSTVSPSSTTDFNNGKSSLLNKNQENNIIAIIFYKQVVFKPEPASHE